MKIANKDFACVTKVQILPINTIPNEIALASNVEIKSDIEEITTENTVPAIVPAKIPYILNGELYEILARDGENVTVKCCYCPAGRFYRGSVRSTGNFHMHIKRRHPYLLGRLHDMKVASLLERRDRLTKNRKTKRLRRSTHRIAQKAEFTQDLHKLKIKRAFQRHQAEAKENHQVSTQTFPVAKDAKIQIFEESPTKNEHSADLKESLPSNLYGDLHLRNNNETKEVQMTTSQSTSPTPTPYPSTYDGSAFGEYNSSPSAIQRIEIATIYDERPLDLSFNGSISNGEETATDVNNYASSGIALGPMYSDTTVANTISTTLSAIKKVSDNHVTTAMFHNFADSNWQRLSLTLRDIHEDINTRNRIEHNRLLLDIAKFKFLHPGFYFNLQE